MDDKRNILLAVVLTIAILFGWPVISNYFFPPSAQPIERAEQQAKQQGAAPNVRGGPLAEGAQAIRPIEAVLGESQRVAIETPKLRGSINLRGARIDDVVLPTHRQTVDEKSPPVRLLAPSGTADAYFASFGWSGEGVRVPDANTVWTADGTKLTPQTPVTLRWSNGAGQTFLIRLSIDEDYLLTVAQTVENAGGNAIAVRNYGLLSRTGHSKDKSTWTIHTGPMGVFNGSANYDIGFDKLDKDGDKRFSTTGGWLGFTDLYWHAALIPAQTLPVDAQFRKGASDRYQADLTYAPAVVQPGTSLSTTSRLFVGAKETPVLDRYMDQQGIALFDRAIDWGWFRWFEKPIFYLLDWLFRHIGNFGVAIICLTFIVRGLMFPVAQRQFASMAAMRAIQPKMKALQERYKNDKPKMQQEIMALYKTEKVNPLAGCLPIFLQIPIFFALYKVLMLTVDMRHQPFYLWIKDLSAPDPAHILNLFGLLPFTPPSFLGIGVLAVILGITMWLQFKLNPAPMDDVQKQIFSLMPWMMMFIMAPFAAGLLIYWCTSNILTIAQQWWLYRQHPVLGQPAADTAKG
ncbi:YidC/Oxa1 family membrane protein insertase [Sphingobium sp. B2D3A]|uniref:membrane protein insertase YidC n=1 Tax=Sphingobium TaxID=165695 RepID=UPI0015EB88B0|nr:MULTISPECIES: membrane protein insertase YidC [Sphingobium]MCW2336874.1 YidC/Oxa1 family membrane protein insertase [Sphingobium sp. B2D3A]MCW2362893.1 YidC/Oxa1 family membrane protein insertase [Sphingobium sp. B10D3B]MCW2386628.1 YidC/Oxa1 family membrane protein insertase [Sphingobium sp. B2D3D]MCW2400427.1 YidC/Oxa1 family membrane protein insertase [Sphingobium sp. B10D7B]MCW2407406.1 YidC/Oxa1 family membrane protein insertase [Sphingobium xanthum]